MSVVRSERPFESLRCLKPSRIEGVLDNPRRNRCHARNVISRDDPAFMELRFSSGSREVFCNLSLASMKLKIEGSNESMTAMSVLLESTISSIIMACVLENLVISSMKILHPFSSCASALKLNRRGDDGEN